jgi:anaerobic magnesium-protoporphyrin IX monomethyl ester cyclase
VKNFKVLLFFPNETLVGVAPSCLPILSACMKQAGFEVKLFDCTMYAAAEETQDQIRAKLGQVKKSDFETMAQPKQVDIYEDFVRVVEEYQPDLIGFNVVDSTISMALSFVKKIVDKMIPIVFGGVGATFNCEKILNSDLVDFVCVGEGEGAIVDLCNKLHNHEDCSSIMNICFKNSNGKIVKNPKRPRVDLDSLPIPDFSIYEYNRFFRPFMGKVVRMAQVDLDRGCPFSCTYCAAPAIQSAFKADNCGRYYRVKNFDKVFAEIKDLMENHDVNFLWISSETLLALSLEKFTEFANRYIREINLPFWCQNRLDMFSEEKTALLAKMGCKAISVGLEHGSERIRKQLLNKHISNQKIIESIKIISKYDIIPTLNNMIGLPDETREDIFETVELDREIVGILKDKHTLNVFTFIPFAGTKLREVCLQKKYITEDQPIPTSFQKESMLTMPSISKEEIYGLEKTLTLYILLPKSYWPEIRKAEKDTEEGREIFNRLMQVKERDYLTV